MLDHLNKIKKNEIKNLYDKLKNSNTERELDQIDKICLDNEKTFIKIIEGVQDTISKIESFKKNDHITKLKKAYELCAEAQDSFSILIAKFFLISFNDLEKNKYAEDDLSNNIIKTRYDVLSFVKEKIYFTYLYLISIGIIDNSLMTQKIINNAIEVMILKIIQTLISNEVIIEIDVFINKKTCKFIEIPNLKKNLMINLYTQKFKVLKKLENMDLDSEHLINGSIFSIYKINKVSGKTGSQFVMGSKDFIEEVNKIKITVDIDSMENLFTNYCKEYDIDKENIEEVYFKYKDQLKQLIYERNNSASSSISKKITIQYKALVFEKLIKKIKEGKNSFYLPFLVDFRGRTYKLSTLSPTFFKEIRQCISLENDKEKKKIEPEIKKIEDNINKIMMKYTSKIDNIKILENLKNLKEKEKIATLWVLISIGEIFKEEIGAKIKIQEFLDFSINKINEHLEGVENTKNNKKNKFLYHIKILKEINNSGSSKKLISKDATASVYQHLVKTLGGKDNESYMITNLTDYETWYDTYSMIIQKWKSESPDIYIGNELTVDEFFNRDNLKKTMMTENYGCGRRKCWDYFKKKIKDKKKIDESIIKKIFNSFYSYLTKNCIFKKNSQEITKEMTNRRGVINNIFDNSKADLMYKKKKIKRINTTHEKKRITMKTTYIPEKYDEEDFELDNFAISIRANFVHFLDGSFAREIVKRIRCIAIHDCFMVEPGNVSRLIAIANYVMNINFIELGMEEKELVFFSLFILL